MFWGKMLVLYLQNFNKVLCIIHNFSANELKTSKIRAFPSSYFLRDHIFLYYHNEKSNHLLIFIDILNFMLPRIALEGFIYIISHLKCKQYKLDLFTCENSHEFFYGKYILATNMFQINVYHWSLKLNLLKLDA